MRIRLSHIVAYGLGLSTNSWVDLLHELPRGVRVVLEVLLAFLPLIAICAVFVQPVAIAAIRAASDRLTPLWILVFVLLWMLSVRVRVWRGKQVSSMEALAVLLVLAVGLRRRRSPAIPA